MLPDTSSVDAQDVERVRVPAERVVARRVGMIERPPSERGAAVTGLRAWVQARALPLTAEIAPAAQGPLRRATQRLGVAEPVELYQEGAADERDWNAQHAGRYDGAVLIVLRGQLLDILDEHAITALLGHELGHHLAHSSRVWTTANAHAWPQADDAVRTALARELTADRFGLLAEPDLAASLRLGMANAGGLRSGSAVLDAEAYRRWCVESVETRLSRGERLFGQHHPEHAVRTYALTLFAETDLFRELSGTGPGTRAIEDVNAVLDRVLGASSATRHPFVHARASQPGPEPAGPSAALEPSSPATPAWDGPADIEIDGLEARLRLGSTALDDLAGVAKAAGSTVKRAAAEAAAWWVGRPSPGRRRAAPGSAASTDEPDEDQAEEPDAKLDPAKADLLARFAALEAKLAAKKEI